LGIDIFQLLEREAERKRKAKREELLKSIGVKEIFVEGKVTINKRTCRGLECKLCIEACPTKALYWAYGEVRIVEELCIYCTACVWNCIVDDCIHVWRKRPSGEVEEFSNPRQVLTLTNRIASRERMERVKSRGGWLRRVPPARRVRRRLALPFR